MAHNDAPNLSRLNYVPLIPYNGTEETGGDSRRTNLNIYYEVSDSGREDVKTSRVANTKG